MWAQSNVNNLSISETLTRYLPNHCGIPQYCQAGHSSEIKDLQLFYAKEYWKKRKRRMKRDQDSSWSIYSGGLSMSILPPYLTIVFTASIISRRKTSTIKHLHLKGKFFHTYIVNFDWKNTPKNIAWSYLKYS